jgi:ankyrin repeat protein
VRTYKIFLTSCLALMTVFLFYTISLAQPLETMEAHELRQAVMKKDAAKVKQLIGSGTDINATFNGRTALHAACGPFGSVEMVKLLLSMSANVNARTEGNGSTPLIMAASNTKGAKELVPLLIKHGARVNARGSNGKTALSEAASRYGYSKDYPNVIKLLISKGADVNAANPLFDAVVKGHVDLVKLLLDHGADPNQRTKTGQTALKWAKPRAESGSPKHKQITELLLARGATMEGSPSKQQPVSQQTKPKPAKKTTAELAYEMNSAVVAGDLAKVKKMLADGLSVNAQDRAGNTAIFMACWMGKKMDIVKFLLSKGADPSVKNVKKQTALFPAAKNKKLYKVLIPLLIEHGVDVKAIDYDGSNVLWPLVTLLDRKVNAKDVLDMVKLVLSKGAGVDPKIEGGRTPLMFAAMGGHLEMVKLLVANGADLKAKSNQGETPLNLAEKGGHMKVVEFLKSKT